MKKYYIKVTHNSIKRGFNRTVAIYTQNKDGSFNFIQEDNEINTASFRGDLAVASKMLHDKHGYKWDPKALNYTLISKNIKLLFLP